MSSNVLVPIKDSIATKLLVVVFSIYFVVTLSVTLVHMVAEYYNTKASIQEDLRVFQDTFEQGVATSMWTLDDSQLHSTLVGIIKIPVIVGVRVEDMKGHVKGAVGMIMNEQGEYLKVDIEGRSRPAETTTAFSKLFWYTFPLNYVDDGVPKQVGVVTFYSSTDVVFQKVQYGFLFIIVNSIIKTAALWIIFLLVGRVLLNRPLEALTSVTRQLSLDNLEHIHIDIKTSGRNELKILEEAFMSMIHKLIVAKNRTASLRLFSNCIASFKDNTQTFIFAFQELSKHTEISNAVFFYDFRKSPLKFDETAHHFLKKLPTPEWMQVIFPVPESEHAVFNFVKAGSPVAQFYADQIDVNQLLGGHIAYHRASASDDHVVCLFREPGHDSFDEGDLEYVQSMLSEIKLAQYNIQAIRENARMEGELRTAAAVQQALFPKSLPKLANLGLASFFQSASETGGDWYGFITQIPGMLFVMIGDVTGHGTPAALVTATASATCRTLEEYIVSTQQTLSPSQFLKYLNKAVFDAGAPNFLMTFFVACIDLNTGVLTFSNAGHNFPILLRSNGKVEHLLNTNGHLGRKAHLNFTENQVQLEPDDKLFFFTDGLIENTNNKSQMWGESRFVRHLKENRHLPVHDLLHTLVQKAYGFYGGHPPDDDMTVVACHVTMPFPNVASVTRQNSEEAA